MTIFRLRAMAIVALVAVSSCQDPELTDNEAVELRTAAASIEYPNIGFETRPSYVANNVIGLSFDDGPDLTNTPAVLDVLKAKNAKATFFINTDNFAGPVENSATLKALIQRIVNEGHQLASHTVHHLHLPTLTSAQIDTEVVGVQTVVNRADVLGPNFPKLTLLRAPYGEPYQGEGPGQPNYDKVAAVVGKYAVHIGWALDTFDYNCNTGTAAANKQCVYNNFINNVNTVGNGTYGMVLMHAVHPQTAAAIGDIIDTCRARGFVFRLAEDFVQAKYGKSSNQLVYGGACNQTPFGGSPRAIPGTIQAEDFDNGGQGCAYSDATAANEGGAYRPGEQVDIQATTDAGGGQNVGWTQPGEWLEYTVAIAAGGSYKLELRTAATAAGRTVDVLVDGAVIAGGVAITNTGNFQTFATVTVPSVTLSAGTRVLRLQFNGSGVNVNWLRFSSLASSSYFYFEAEAGGGAATAPMSVQGDGNASGGQYIWSGNTGSNAAVPGNGHVTFAFNAPVAGTYKVWGRFLVGPAGAEDDSLWSRIDGSPFVQWNDVFARVGNAGYRWDSEHDTVNANGVITRSLGAGNHVLEIAYRETGLKIDRFLVTNDLAFVP
ncbi:MAG TPA: polysaccharide deacetylase family protein [Polyangia bacterium]|nr:polysaccharide deacetylase family protein [Polyangia bacterium]